MATKKIYICSNCNETFLRWAGKCESCGAWNTINEEIVENEKSSSKAIEKKKAFLSFMQNNEMKKLYDVDVQDDTERIKTNIEELDRVLGGGFVKGSFSLLSGEPGAGKSTLVLHICEALQELNNIIYITGEESTKQVKLRANRLGVSGKNVNILSENNVQHILEIMKQEKPDFLIIDSIQTMISETVTSSAGSISQVKETASLLLDVAKENNISTIIIGHVNKDGAIAGPKVLEHLVDTVLYFEGDKMLPFTILRATKNRYGSTNEIGMFEMTSTGLKEIKNPSETLLAGRPINVSGSCISCVIEGTRPVLSEIQALTTPTPFGTPRRTTAGFDYNRANVLYAIIEKRLGYNLGSKDIYINIVGGLKLNDTACDLSVAIAVISSFLDKICSVDIIAVGELGLGGEVRGVNFIESRIKESEKLGFNKIIIPKNNFDKINPKDYKIEIIPISYLKDIITLFKK